MKTRNCAEEKATANYLSETIALWFETASARHEALCSAAAHRRRWATGALQRASAEKDKTETLEDGRTLQGRKDS